MPIRQTGIATVLLAALAAPALAQDKGFYLGLGAGASKARDAGDCSDIFVASLPSTCSTNSTDFGWKAFAGYQFTESLALEAGYVDLGKFKTSGTGTVAFFPGPNTNASEDFHPSGFSVDVIGTLPFGNGFGLLGRIGVFRWTLKSSASASAGAFPIVSSTDKPTGTSVDFGIGAKWDFSRSLGARVEFQRFKSIGDEEVTGKADVDLLSASLLYRF